MSFGFCGFRHLLKSIFADGASASAFHLLEIIDAFHVAHKEQNLQRFYVSACGNHIHRDGNARIKLVAKAVEYRFGIFLYLVS